MNADGARLTQDQEKLTNAQLVFCIDITQEEVDAGKLPYFIVECDYEDDEHEDCGLNSMLMVDAMSVFDNAVDSAEAAEIIAEWLEGFAIKIREKYGIKK
jgi:hypothetical protein